MPLVITRKKGQRVRVKVGKEYVWVSVEGVDRNQVRLGFDGDKVDVLREELLEKGTNDGTEDTGADAPDDPRTRGPLRHA